jgi:hypothetical protein
VGSLSATVELTANGTVEGEATEGALTVQLTTTDQNESRIEVTGDLLGDIVAKVGGRAVSLFRPSRVTVYTVADETYVVVSGLFDVCIKPGDNLATVALGQLSPATLMDILTSSEAARGTLIGDETLGDRAVRHYLIDGEAFLAAAQSAMDDSALSRFTSSLRTASDADLYVDAAGGYPVAYRGGFTGAFEPLDFDGDLGVSIDLTGIGEPTTIELPGACDRPIST